MILLILLASIFSTLAQDTQEVDYNQTLPFTNFTDYTGAPAMLVLQIVMALMVGRMYLRKFGFVSECFGKKVQFHAFVERGEDNQNI